MRRLSLVAVFLTPLAARADTVFLKNGEWIDGKVSLKTESFVELQIGDIGKIELPVEEIHSIEKNTRTGGSSVESSYVEPKGKTEVLGKRAKQRRSLENMEKLPTDAQGKPEVAASDKLKNPAAMTPAEAAKLKAEQPETPGEEEAAPEPEEEKPALPEIDPELKKRIEALVADLQRQKTRNRVQAERHLEAIGQPAIPYLIPIAKNPSDLTRVAVMRLFHSFGDQQVLEPAIEGLLDDNEYVRDLAHKALKRISGEDFGYQPNASPRRREAAQRKWAEWWESEKKLLAEERKLAGEAR